MKKKITKEAAQAAAKEWLAADVLLQQTQAAKRAEVTPIVQKFEEEERTHIGKKDEAETILEQYAVENRDELLPAGKKSTDFAGATIGWKKSPPSLALADGKTWEEVTKSAAEKMPEYVIDKQELDKAGILRNAESLNGELAGIGVIVQQKEAFYVKA